MTSSTGKDIAVVGGGVIGLTTAVLAEQAGHRVTLCADQEPLATTSARAAASFKPHEVTYADPSMLERAWKHFERLASDPVSGVRTHTHWEASSSPLPDQPYLGVMHNVKPASFPDVPGGYRYGRSYTTFFVDMPVFLPWLRQQFKGKVVLLSQRYRSLKELAALPHDVVINCTGLGARELCNDRDVYPLKGQVALVEPHNEIDFSISADGFYCYPRRNDTVLGGTAEPNVETETTDDIALRLLVRGNRRIIPSLTDASVPHGVAGLRPCRTTGVRIEAETIDGRKIIHNYGHGGGGVTLSWGSAELALQLV